MQGANPTNVVQRLLFPMRGVAPLDGLHYSVSGEYVFAGDHPFFRTAYPFSSGPRSAAFSVKPPPAKGRPSGFGGIVAEAASLFEYPENLAVETNDVVTVKYSLKLRGYVPESYHPEDVAFEWTRQTDADGVTEVRYTRYFVADGVSKTPVLEIPYYDTRRRAYASVSAGGTRLAYRPADTAGETKLKKGKGEAR